MARVLSFSQYHRLNEKEGDNSERGPLVQAADAVLNAFFQLYSQIVPRIGEYKDSISDLRSLEKEQDIAKIGDKMKEILTKIGGKLPDVYSGQKSDVAAVVTAIETAWKLILKDDNLEKVKEDIKSLVGDKFDSYIQGLIQASKEKQSLMKKEGPEKNESTGFSEIGGILILEGKLSNDRDQLSSELTTLKAQLQSFIDAQKGVDATKEFRDKCREARKMVDEFMRDISPEKFDDMKRSGKKERMQEIRDEVLKIQSEIQQLQTKALAKIGLGEQIRKALVDLDTKAKELAAKFGESDLKKVEAKEKGKDDDDESGKKEEGLDSKDFNEIKVGGDNASKKGKNRDNIKSWQNLYNTINPGKKISADGLFGRSDKKRGETEDAIVYTAKLLGNLLGKPELVDSTKDGNVLTPELQALTKKFVEDIVPNIKSKLKTEAPKKEEKPKEKED